MARDEDRPEWWVRNERLRRSYDLPAYDPPRFEDGEYSHEVVGRLESRFGCTIQLIGVNTRYPDEWQVEIDGDSRFTIPHSRDANGNTLYGIDSESFVERVREHVR
jgi:hypothetical protein